MRRNDFEAFIPRMFPDVEIDFGSGNPRLTPCPACGSQRSKPCVLLFESTKIYCHDGGCLLNDHPRDLREFVTELKLWPRIGTVNKQTPKPIKPHALLSSSTGREHEIYRAASVFFHLNLLRNPKCRSALDYQLSTRGHQLETLMHFQVGFTGHLYDLGEKLLSLSKWSHAEILGCGLFTSSGKLRPYMRFSYPIVFKGRTRSIKFKHWVGNDLDFFLPVEKTGDDFPLILNARELGADQPLLCEGENDLLSLWEKGETHTVCMLGNLKARSLEFLDEDKTYRMAFDHDDAGRDYELSFQEKFRAVVFEYPERFKDPDDWCQAK
jgi:DNA primase